MELASLERTGADGGVDSAPARAGGWRSFPGSRRVTAVVAVGAATASLVDDLKVTRT